MSASQPALFNVQEFTDGGTPLVGGRLYTYNFGTTTLKVAFTDPEGTVPQTYTADGLGGQYIALNARGELPSPLYLAVGPYDIALRRADGSTVWTRRADPTGDSKVALAAPSGAGLLGFSYGIPYGAGTVGRWITDLALSPGASKIGVKLPGLNAPLITVERAATESVSLVKYGGKDDFDGTIGTDNLTPILGILADYPQGIQIDLPYTNTGTYRFGYFEANLLNGFTLNPAPGVTLRFADAQPLVMAGVKAAHPVKLYFEALKYNFTYSPYVNKTELEKTRFVDAGVLDQSQVKLAYTDSSEAAHVRMSWPDGPFTAITPATPDGYDVVLVPVVNGNSFDLTLFPAIGGTEITTCVKPGSTLAAGTLLAVGVRLVQGHIIVFAGPGLRPNFSVMEKIGSAAAVSKTRLYKGSTTHASYSWDKSMLTVRVHNPRSFSIMLNGVEIYFAPDTQSDILDCGFGAGFNTAASTVTLANWTRMSRKLSAGMRPLNLMVVGDSITDGTIHGSWPGYMREALENTLGIRVEAITNLAVSGDNSAQQLTRVAAAVTGGIDAMLILVGANDIQGAVPVSSYLSNIDQMLTLARNNDMIPIVGIPTMFYGRAQAALAGGMGQDVANYEFGSHHRTALLHWLAAHAVKPVTATLEDLGPVLADYLNSGTKDAIVMDNIHPTALGRRLIGYAFAKAVAGTFNPAVHRSIPRQQVVASWVNPVGSMTQPGNEVTFSVDNGDRVTWGGWCKLASAATPGMLVEVMRVPRALWPNGVVRINAKATASGGTPIGETVTIILTADGIMQVWFDTATPGGFYLDGMDYTRAFTQAAN